MTTKKSKDFLDSKASAALEHELLGKPLTFGMAIESLRDLHELSQIKLAKKLGISKQYLCDVEKGRKLVSPDQAVRFAKAMGHPPAFFVKLSLQDSVNQTGLKLKVTVEAA